MATLILGAVGAAAGSAIGGTILGVSATAAGQFIGAAIGQSIDQRILGTGSQSFDAGRVERVHLTSAGEGFAIPQVYGRMRVGSHVIWASPYTEHVTEESAGGGKGGGPKVTTRMYSYTVNVALGLCQGEISGIGRIWANGEEIDQSQYSFAVYHGTRTQQPDPTIAAYEPDTPAYRGTAYIVFENFDITAFGNRMPQLSVEVIRPAPAGLAERSGELAHLVQGVAMIPGSGEYSLATEPVYITQEDETSLAANINTSSQAPDFMTSLSQLEAELPRAKNTSLVVSWFGDDLRCGSCEITPRVENKGAADGQDHPWEVAGISRDAALQVPLRDDRPVYGGTPTDRSVIDAIKTLKSRGQEVMFYPFILMAQDEGNGLPDPWGGAEQPKLPWRGRITTTRAPQIADTSDQTAAAADEVAAFFGTAAARHFTVSDGSVTYSGPDEWRYRRFILHNAALCKAAGGVSSFCIGSEMVALTQIRSDTGFPAVEALIDLAQEVRHILGPNCKIGYAADWSEYFGYAPQDGSGDRYFHLDPLWADDAIDFIGIDNYMPISDWRGDPAFDTEAASLYDLDYLQSGVMGGEGYDWYYASQADRDAKKRTPITDGDHGEPWVWRYKDLVNWWSQAHHDRINGVRSVASTAWVPQSKPIWFTELGCAAIDKATNQPNKFLDPKSSESSLPYYSTGVMDEYIQTRFLEAVIGYWSMPAHNPVSQLYGAPMLDLSRVFIWAWDARPFPWFPNQTSVWSDGENYLRGHWLTGRGASRTLASVIAQICREAGLTQFDVTAVYGSVAGYSPQPGASARTALQSLMLYYGVDAIEADGTVHFIMRAHRARHYIDPMDAIVSDDHSTGLEYMRSAQNELSGRVRVQAIEAGLDFAPLVEEAQHPDNRDSTVDGTQMRLLMRRGEGRDAAQRWLAEAALARERVKFSLPPSYSELRIGDHVQFSFAPLSPIWRLDRLVIGDVIECEAVRVDPNLYGASGQSTLLLPDTDATRAPSPIQALFMDLPLLTSSDDPHAPYVASFGWAKSGPMAIYSSVEEAEYQFDQTLSAAATVGRLATRLSPMPAGVLWPASSFEISTSGRLSSITQAQLLAGGNAAAIWHEGPQDWEILQFQEAHLQEGGRYLLRGLIRGQRGTSHLADQPIEPEAHFVLLNAVLRQPKMHTREIGAPQFYRIGQADLPPDHPSYIGVSHAGAAVGLRPFPVAHLRHSAGEVTWIRQTRVDGELWGSEDPPMGEEQELYQVTLYDGSDVILRTRVTAPRFEIIGKYARADRVEVAQVSQLYGVGVTRSVLRG